MVVTNKLREEIMATCIGVTTFEKAREASKRLTSFAEKHRVKRLVKDVLSDFNSNILCEVVTNNRSTSFEKLAIRLAYEFINAIQKEEI